LSGSSSTSETKGRIAKRGNDDAACSFFVNGDIVGGRCGGSSGCGWVDKGPQLLGAARSAQTKAPQSVVFASLAVETRDLVRRRNAAGVGVIVRHVEVDLTCLTNTLDGWWSVAGGNANLASNTAALNV
jgi:hypothetical protein